MAGRGGVSTTVLTWGVVAVVSGFWAVVGLIFWLPVMIGGVARFSVAHLGAMLEGRVPAAAGSRLRSAVSFYGRGFSSAVDLARGDDGEPWDSGPRSGPSAEALGLGRLLRATGWAALTWYAVLVMVGGVAWPPAQVQEIVGAGTWWDLAGVIGSGVGGALSDLAHAAARVAADGAPVP